MAAHNDPRPREPVGAHFARKRETGIDGFTRQWSLASSDNLETVPKGVSVLYSGIYCGWVSVFPTTVVLLYTKSVQVIC